MRLTQVMAAQQIPPRMMALPPRLTNPEILVLSPIALMAMTIQNFDIVFKLETRGRGRGNSVVISEASTK